MKKTEIVLSVALVLCIALVSIAQEPVNLSDADLKKIAEMVREDSAKKPVWSSLDIQLYGYIKLDAAYDTERTSVGNFARWVESDALRQGDDQFNMTANQTRLAKISGPNSGDTKTSGKLELDFYGSAAAENKPQLMMRHAYMKIDWPEVNFSILAGQTSDVISPLFPSTLNYTVGWWAGNMGYRRPQIRLTKICEADDVTIKTDIALARTIGGSSAFGPGDSGEDTGYPGIQTRVGITLPLLGEKPTTIGASGHWAKEEYDTDAMDHHENYDSWSLNLDLLQPVCDGLTIKGEVFTGDNLSAYLGGIAQGVNLTADEEISSTGGWIAASLGPWDKLGFNVGATMECVDSDDIADGSKELNSSVFSNVIYSLNKKVQVGLELSQWHTEREHEGSADSIRSQASFIYKF